MNAAYDDGAGMSAMRGDGAGMSAAYGDGAVCLRRVRQAADWEACRAAQCGATAFHCWEWLRTMGAALGNDVLPLGFYQGATLVGLAPLLVKRIGPYKNANWSPFPYLGPLVPAALAPQALRAFDAYQRRNGIGLIQLGFAPDAAVAARALEACGYSVRTDTTMMLALAGRTEQQLWDGLTSHGKKNVKRAQKGGVTVRPSTEQEIGQELPEIMREVFAPRHQPPPYPPEAAALVWERYHDDPSVRMATAYCEGKPAAISITIADGARAYFWQGASRNRFRNVNPNALVYWDAICWARERGYTALDMVGNPDPGIAYYKSTFGSVETPYLVAYRENSRLIAWARRAHGRGGSLAHDLAARLRQRRAGRPRQEREL